MKGYNGEIEKITLDNNKFRQVLYTGKNSQLVVMSLKPGQDIGSEVHVDHDQFFRFESGVGKVVIDGTETEVKDGSASIVPAGAEHNVINTSETEDLKLYTIYSPPEHRFDVVHNTKEIALSDDEHFDGTTTE